MAAYCACKYYTLRVTGARDWQDGQFKIIYDEFHPRGPQNVSKLMRRAQIELGASRSEAIMDPKKIAQINYWPQISGILLMLPNHGKCKRPNERRRLEGHCSPGAHRPRAAVVPPPRFPRFGLHDMLDRREKDTDDARVKFSGRFRNFSEIFCYI